MLPILASTSVYHVPPQSVNYCPSPTEKQEKLDNVKCETIEMPPPGQNLIAGQSEAVIFIMGFVETTVLGFRVLGSKYFENPKHTVLKIKNTRWLGDYLIFLISSDFNFLKYFRITSSSDLIKTHSKNNNRQTSRNNRQRTNRFIEGYLNHGYYVFKELPW